MSTITAFLALMPAGLLALPPDERAAVCAGIGALVGVLVHLGSRALRLSFWGQGRLRFLALDLAARIDRRPRRLFRALARAFDLDFSLDCADPVARLTRLLAEAEAYGRITPGSAITPHYLRQGLYAYLKATGQDAAAFHACFGLALIRLRGGDAQVTRPPVVLPWHPLRLPAEARVKG